jgi:hypothetical protein
MKRRQLAAVGVALALVACSDDDDASPTTTPETTVVDTSAPATTSTEPPPTTEAPTTTAAPSTTLSEEQLRAQIAADYLRSNELLDELTSNPTLDNLDARIAQIVAPGSTSYQELRAFVEGMVSRGERVVNGDPDYSTVTVERVELTGPPFQQATVIACVVTNRARIDGSGNTQQGTGQLVAIRTSETVVPTANGWLPTGPVMELWSAAEVIECPAQ